MQKMKMPIYEIASLVIGELFVSALTVGIFLLTGYFELSVIFGVLLGAGVVILNFIALSLITNHTLDTIMEERGTEEMDEEAAAAFAAKHRMKLQNTVRLSFILRMAALFGTLILAFLLQDVFNVIATVVPLLSFRPIITVSQMIRKRRRIS
ncbi:MAG: hypothetical protein J6Q69_06640 [Clostridia bacterium]|nr:hypothetical protein [Clostridia bacterium]